MKKKFTRLILKALFVIIVIALAFYLANIAQDNLAVQSAVAKYGYLGVFIVSLISGFNLVVPIPAVSFLPAFTASGLSVVLAITIITIGMTIADIITYILGRAGRLYLEKDMSRNKLFKRLESAKERHPYAPIGIVFLFASFAPMPNEVLLIPLGFIGSKTYLIIIAVFAGNFVFNIIYATGIIQLFNVLV